MSVNVYMNADQRGEVFFRWSHGDGKPIAVIGLPPENLPYGKPLAFHPGWDNLDHFVFAVLQLDERTSVVLLRYANDSDPGTTIYADTTADAHEITRRVLEWLGFDNAILTWVADAESVAVANTGG